MEDFYTEIVKRVAKAMVETCKEECEKEVGDDKPEFIKEAATNLASSYVNCNHFWNSVQDEILAQNSPVTKEEEILPYLSESHPYDGEMGIFTDYQGPDVGGEG